jgi:CheY-like chemotaxis protein
MIRCLVVDDDGEIRTAVRDYLRRFGMLVSTAASGAASSPPAGST